MNKPQPQITLQICEGGYIVNALVFDSEMEIFEWKTLVHTDLDTALGIIKRCALALEGPDDFLVPGDVFGGMTIE